MSRTPLFAVLLALGLTGTVLAGAAGATPHRDREAEPGEQTAILVLPKAAIGSALRRTAVADPDLDGVVSGREATQYYATRFRLLDENRDDSVDEPEFLRAAAVRSLYAPDEFAQPRPLAFESVDVDGNGVLTPEEFLRANALSRNLAAAGGIDERRQTIFEAIDTDHDGALSQREFMDGGLREFSGSDVDADGKVTVWEFYAATRL